MTTMATAPEHPVLACARRVGAALDEVAGVEPCFMPVADKAAALVELSRAASRVQALMLRVLAVSDDVALDEGARSAGSWLSRETRSDRRAGARQDRLAAALEERHGQVRDALLAGRVNLEQADAIVGALDGLPSDLDDGTRTLAESHLVAEAEHFDPRALRMLGRKVLEVVAPDVHDDQERRALEAEERRARQETSVHFRSRGDGRTDIAIRVPDAVAGRLRTYLEAYAAPRRGHLQPAGDHTDPETGERIPYPVLLGRAFCSMLESVPTERLPRHGGSPTAVVVTIDLDSLRSDLGVAGLASGERISASEAMRLACTASILPMVLGGNGQPLHLGRARRLFTPAQRTALAVRDGRCRARGCDVPAAWCEAHHLTRPWSRGGRTDLRDGALLCSWHHHRAHDPDYRVELMADGEVRFHRRT